MEPNTVRLWKAAFPIEKALNGPRGLAFFADDKAINALVQKCPTSYLSELEFWSKALRNQLFYAIDGRDVCVACMAKRPDGTLSTLVFSCFYDDFKLIISSVEESRNCLRSENWAAVKTETRKARGY